MPEMSTRPGRGQSEDRRWVALAALCVSLLMVSLDNTILNVALPTIARSMNATTSDLQWIVDSYIVVFAGLLLLVGSLGDRLGRKWVFMTGLVVFAAGSTASAFCTTPTRLVAARAVMGLGGAAIMPSTLSLIRNIFTEPSERARAIGIWSGTSGLSVALGPVVGGYLLAHFWWGSVFLVNVPIALAGLVASAFVVPNSRNPESRRPDPLGGLLSTLGMAALLWAIIEAPQRAWTSTAVLASLTGGIALLMGFVLWEQKCDHAMLQLVFFRSRRFSAAMGAMAMLMLALMGSLFLLTQYLQFALGYTALEAGVRVAPIAGVILVAAPLSAVIVHRMGTKPVVVSGLSLIAAGLFILSHTTVHGTYLDALPSFFLIGTGVGLSFAPSTEAVMGSLPTAEAGAGAATNGAALETGGALGVGIFGSLLGTRYRDMLAPMLAPHHVPSAVLQLIEGSLGGALEVVKRIGGSLGASLAIVAREAFVSGMDLALTVGGVLVTCGAVVVLILLPNRAPPAAKETGEAERVGSRNTGGPPGTAAPLGTDGPGAKGPPGTAKPHAPPGARAKVPHPGKG